MEDAETASGIHETSKVMENDIKEEIEGGNVNGSLVEPILTQDEAPPAVKTELDTEADTALPAVNTEDSETVVKTETTETPTGQGFMEAHESTEGDKDASGDERNGDKSEGDGDDSDKDAAHEVEDDEEDDQIASETKEKLNIDGAKTDGHDEEGVKDDGPAAGKAFEKIKKLKEEMEQKLKEILPAAFQNVRRLTVNIGPIKLVDLKSAGLHGILNLTTHFEMTYDKQKGDDKSPQDRIRRFSHIEYDGYVKMRFEVGTPQFFVLVYNKLHNLNINGKNMSVKLPDQFAETLKEAKEYRKKREELYKEFTAETAKLRFDEKQRSVYVRNLSKNVDSGTLKNLFPEAVEVIGPSALGSGDAIGATLIFATREDAKKCMEEKKDVVIDEKAVKLLFIMKGGKDATLKGAEESKMEKRKKRKKKKQKGPGAGDGGSARGQPKKGGKKRPGDAAFGLGHRSGQFERMDTGGGSARKRMRGPNRGGFDEGMGMMGPNFPYPDNDSDPYAMITMLRSTLERMEENLSYGEPGGYMDEGFRGNRRTMGYDEFGGGGGRFMPPGGGYIPSGRFGPGGRTSLLGEPPGFSGFGGGGGMDTGYPQFGGGGGRNRRRRGRNK